MNRELLTLRGDGSLEGGSNDDVIVRGNAIQVEFLEFLELVEIAAAAIVRREGLTRLQALDRLSDDFGFSSWFDLELSFNNGDRIEMPEVVDENDRPMRWIDLYVDDETETKPSEETLANLEYIRRAAKLVKRRDGVIYTQGLRKVCQSLGFRSFRELSTAFEDGHKIVLPSSVGKSGEMLRWIDQFR